MSTPSTPPTRGPDLRRRLIGGRYRLEGVIAGGGSGNVYRACDRRLRRKVAVKVIHPEHGRTVEQRRRIRQEALCGAQISHANVAQILDFGTDGEIFGESLFFIVMPLFEGRTLREIVLDGTPRWAKVGVWVHQLLGGLAALHGAGVLHRDIKLENCLITQEGGREVLKLVDLGLAKVTRAGPFSQGPRSITGRLVGTLAYMSPEQALGEPVDERSDLYAVGVVLFELLTRRQPFRGSDYQVLNGHVEQPPPRPSEFAAAPLPGGFDALTLRALAKDKEQRFASALSFDAALIRLLDRAGVDVHRLSHCAGCSDARSALAAWTCFDYTDALEWADSAARQSRAWSPLKLLMSLLPEE